LFSFCLFELSRNVREKSHKSCSLYGLSELSLICSGNAAALLAEDSSVGIEKLFQDLGILVVDMLNVILFEETLLAHNF